VYGWCSTEGGGREYSAQSVSSLFPGRLEASLRRGIFSLPREARGLSAQRYLSSSGRLEASLRRGYSLF